MSREPEEHGSVSEKDDVSKVGLGTVSSATARGFTVTSQHPRPAELGGALRVSCLHTRGCFKQICFRPGSWPSHKNPAKTWFHILLRSRTSLGWLPDHFSLSLLSPFPRFSVGCVCLGFILHRGLMGGSGPSAVTHQPGRRPGPRVQVRPRHEAMSSTKSVLEHRAHDFQRRN